MAETTTMQEKVFVNPDHSSQVLYQLSELWRDKKLCDATIEVGPVKVYVHRLVLLAACPYLLTIGGQHDVPVLEVKLPMSVGLEGLNVFLTYLYDGVLNLTTSNLLSVEKISKILKVTGIKRFCQEFRHMDQTVREAVGPSEQFVSDYSINMTDNNMKIIFSEYAGNVGELKRETNEPETEPTEPKRKKMSIDSLSSALQQQGSNNAASSRIQKLTEGSRDRIKVKISRNKEGFTSNTASSNPDSTGDSETTGVHIKQEPISYSDYEDDNTESYDESSRDQTQTDFVRQAPYNTQAFPDEESGFSVTDHHHPQKTDPESEPVGNVDASQVLQKVVKSMPEMALGLDTAAEMGEDNQPQMFMTVNESSKKTPKSKHAVPVASGSKNQEEILRFENPLQRSNSTKKNTVWGMKIFQDWNLDNFGKFMEMITVSPETLANALNKFYGEAKPKDLHQTDKYTRNTLKNIRGAINRHLQDIGRDIDIVHDKEFKSANRALDGILKERLQTVTSPTFHKDAIDPVDLQKICIYLQNAPLSPIVLRHSIWFNISVHFMTRGQDFHELLRLDSFRFHSDDSGDYVTLSSEIQQKMYQDGIKRGPGPTEKRMYATGTPTCPVKMLKLLINKTDTNATHLYNRYNREAVENRGESMVWFNSKRISKCSLSSFMTEICKNARIENRYTPNSLRATTIQSLINKGHEAKVIMSMFGMYRQPQKSLIEENLWTTAQKKSLSTTLSAMIAGDNSSVTSHLTATDITAVFQIVYE